MIVKHCEICGGEYEAYRSIQRYCDDCRDEGRRRRQRVSSFALPPVSPTTFVRASIRSAPNGQRIVLIADHHYPFHDTRTWNAVANFIDDYKPHVIVWDGDIGDFYSISVFDKNPKRSFHFKDEMVGLRGFIHEHRNRWYNAEHIYLKGNHEHRVDTLIKKNKDFAGLIDLESILHLQETDFTVLPYGGVYDYLGYAITHGTKYSSLPNATARMHADMIGGSGAVAHSHRVGRWTYTDLRGTHAFYEIGCLCRLDPDYVAQRPPNWQQGFMAGMVHRNKVHLHQIAIYPDGFYGPFTEEFYAR